MTPEKDVNKNKCSTCYGYGLWVIGEPCPIGRMDATHMPTKKCPECGKGGEDA